MQQEPLRGAPVVHGGEPAELTAKPASRQSRWQSENPKAAWAWQCYRSALKRGLVRREPCEICGAEKTDAPHEIYDEPLRVRHLCRRHHRRLHARERGK